MAATTPPPPTKKAEPKQATPPAVVEAVKETLPKPADSHQNRLRKVVATLMDDRQTPSTAASLLSTYAKFANPKMTCEHLPRSLRPHKRNPDRPLTAATKWDVLFHLIGSAADALQKAYAADLTYAVSKGDMAKGAVLNAIAVLESRVAYLEKLVAARPNNWELDGGDDVGYYINIK